ncbi:class I SAM-dependent methyltransferase [Halomicroarcula sp. GCM10025709]|uniref:class I SAM-dependent methyltransferase n=1 Tax=Haloarcula TaxID=2237 RepID=UPI0024C22B06|nr:class I SAM-dependent methyltransferase [Halomicroarcula sp. YJ-61-S]
MCSQSDWTDAFGRMVRDFHRDAVDEQPRYRRLDGSTGPAHLAGYFEPPSAWHDFERTLLAECSGRVLDAGCGAGRHALALDDRGYDLLAFDRSPGAVAVARDRGVDQAVVGDIRAPPVTGPFDTVVAFGKQLGVGSSVATLQTTLRALAGVVAPGGRLLADLDDCRRDAPDRTWVGNAAVRRFRVEYDGLTGPWTDLLLVDPARFEQALDGTYWRLERVLGADRDRPDYAVVLERTAQSV